MAEKNHVYQVEDLRNEAVVVVHGSRLKLYHGLYLNQEITTSYIVSSEIGMPVQYLMSLADIDDNMMVEVRWGGRGESENTLGPRIKLFKDVRNSLERSLRRKNALVTLVLKVDSKLVSFSYLYAIRWGEADYLKEDYQLMQNGS